MHADHNHETLFVVAVAFGLHLAIQLKTPEGHGALLWCTGRQVCTSHMLIAVSAELLLHELRGILFGVPGGNYIVITYDLSRHRPRVLTYSVGVSGNDGVIRSL